MKVTKFTITNVGHRMMVSLFFPCLILGCSGQQQPKSYSSELTGSDSLIIKMGQWNLLKYHSDRLGFDINYPSFLIHQELPEEAGMQELFMMDDVSLSVMSGNVDSLATSPGQQMMSMGADLVEVTDRYSIQVGQEDQWEYYGKVIDDSSRVITIILRYYPEHAESVEALKEWVRDFDVK